MRWKHPSVVKALTLRSKEGYPSTGNDSRFSRLDLQGLQISEKEWSIAGRPTQNYLDISCTTGTLPSFRRPFLRFAEDVLYEICQEDTEPSDAVYKTGKRWRKFWSADTTREVSTEWLYGIFGEIVFLKELMNRYGSSVLASWTGPLGRDHDFQIGADIAAEVKTSIQTPFKIHCNLRQLDTSLFKDLFIVCYRVGISEGGQTLPELIRQIEKIIDKDATVLDEFYERLLAAGYSKQLDTIYAERPLECSEATVFRVDSDFPKLIETSFNTAPDHRISDIRYCVQLTGLKEESLDSVNDIFARFSE